MAWKRINWATSKVKLLGKLVGNKAIKSGGLLWAISCDFFVFAQYLQNVFKVREIF